MGLYKTCLAEMEGYGSTHDLQTSPCTGPWSRACHVVLCCLSHCSILDSKAAALSRQKIYLFICFGEPSPWLELGKVHYRLLPSFLCNIIIHSCQVFSGKSLAL